jgi:hypothetical protein
VTDSIIASTNSFFAGNNDQEREQTSLERHSHSAASRVNAAAASNPHHKPLNLREALEWLLGSAPNPEEDDLSHEDKTARSNRRMELLLWLLNLEPRLAPYGDSY